MRSSKTDSLLLILVFSQFAGTSLWFAGNAIIDQLPIRANQAGITSSVQFGFIAGTLVFALLTIADRFAAKKIFFYSSLLAAAANAMILLFFNHSFVIQLLRFATGFFLAGIYPVGMKIAAEIFPDKLGRALGLLVGALVAGTSFSHLVRAQWGNLHWEVVIVITSLLAVVGGFLVLLLLPSIKKTVRLAKQDFNAAFRVFRQAPFRAVAFGYFGHMWELYAFWSVLPLLFAHYNLVQQTSENIYWWSFLVIATGSFGCAVGGAVSQRWGSKNVAFTALLFSGGCCVLAPFFFQLKPVIFYGFLLFWGFTVTADSPQFSALVAKEAEAKNKGTALTIVTSLGFAITIGSIFLLKEAFDLKKEYAFWLLAPGPAAGLIALRKKK